MAEPAFSRARSARQLCTPPNGGCFQKFAPRVKVGMVPRSNLSAEHPAQSRRSIAKADEWRGDWTCTGSHVPEPSIYSRPNISRRPRWHVSAFYLGVAPPGRRRKQGREAPREVRRMAGWHRAPCPGILRARVRAIARWTAQCGPVRRAGCGSRRILRRQCGLPGTGCGC